MSHPDKPSTGFSLSRWSKRKLAAARAGDAEPIPSPPAPAPGQPAAGALAPPAAMPPELPPVETLTLESDFSAFLQPTVEEPLKRAALRKLFSDPRFNVMDGLDVYIDDYSKSEPIPPELLAQLAHARAVLDPPVTRVNDRGQVEDVPADDAAAARPPGASEPAAIGEASAEASREAAAMRPSHLSGERVRTLEGDLLTGTGGPVGATSRGLADDRDGTPDDCKTPSTRSSVKGPR